MSPPPFPRWRREAVVAVILFFQVFGTHMASQDEQPGRIDLDVLGYVLLAGGPVLLLLGRRSPRASLVGVVGTTFVYYALAYPYGPAFVALVFAILWAVMAGHVRTTAVVCAVGYGGYLALASLVDRDPPGVVQAGAFGAWLTVMVVGSELIRSRRERLAEIARSRAEEARRKQGEERLRIARELHDVLAHNISLINVQAGVALHLIDDQPDQARTALAAIKDASKEALGELRSVLNVLRGEGEDDGAPRAPAPTLARLDELIDRSTAAGLPVELAVEGTPRPLPPTVDLNAYRIVQEALTNVTRHAGMAAATVTVTFGADELVVRIEDDGYGATVPVTTPADQVGTGSGIAGMRHRAESLGGTLVAGPRPGGGFRVVAALPMAAAEMEAESETSDT